MKCNDLRLGKKYETSITAVFFFSFNGATLVNSLTNAVLKKKTARSYRFSFTDTFHDYIETSCSIKSKVYYYNGSLIHRELLTLSRGVIYNKCGIIFSIGRRKNRRRFTRDTVILVCWFEYYRFIQICVILTLEKKKTNRIKLFQIRIYSAGWCMNKLWSQF